MPSAEALPTPGPLAPFRKYFNIFRTSLIERMTYRGDFFLSTILRFLPMITTILLWRAIYQGSGQDEISNFRYREMIAYLLLVHISRMFSSMPGLAGGIARDIRDGNLKKYLLQPIDMIAYLASYRLAHKVTYILTSCLPYALLFFLCRSFFDGWPDWTTLGCYAVSLCLGFLVGFFFEASIGTIGFWFLEVTSLLYVVNTLNFFISGHMFPLDMLPDFWAGLLKSLPFQYLAYFPAAVFLGKIRGAELVNGLLAEAFWAVAFMVLSRVLYRIGLRQYSAYGGIIGVTGLGRYLRLLSAFGRFCLARELAFRWNFLVSVSVEVLWLSILLGFYRIVFGKTTVVADWSEAQYLFFVGCYFALEGVMETVFLENCNEFADLVRSGDLDFILLKPIDEQFLISCRSVGWSSVPSILMGFGVMVLALAEQSWTFDLTRVLVFALVFAGGVAIAYSCLLLLASTSIWFVRNQSLYELWWLFTSLARYPREIYLGEQWVRLLGQFFTYAIPILLVVNVPASAMVKVLDLRMVAFTLVAATVMLFLSRRFLQYSLRRYRSASS